MGFKKYLITIALILLIIPSVAASVSIEDTLKKFEETADRYDKGDISLAQMIVLLEHRHDENQKKMNEENIAGWSKSEVQGALEEYKYPYGYLMKTHDMYIFLGTWSDDGEHYDFGYSVGGRKFPQSYYENEFEDDVEDLVEDLQNWFNKREPSTSEVGKKMESVFAADSEIASYEECIDIVEDMNVVKEINKDDLPEWYFDF
ncbi:hypothetical protein GF336_03660, partial [Candidatus Woesearchaeota archaeon]|nr:hypothetical protein [Candidatus Woesearchaeota archaeon]